MGLSEGCPSHSDNSCQVSCKDPNVPNTCRILTALLIDGSPCGKSFSANFVFHPSVVVERHSKSITAGFGGTCVGGKCQSGGALDTAKVKYTYPFVERDVGIKST